MRALLVFLLAGSALAPIPAFAQGADLEAVKRQLEQMQAEVARLTAQVSELQAREQAREAESTPLTSGAPAPPPAPAVACKGAPEIRGEGGWSFKPLGRLQ